jgi:hypothetical protein
MFVIATFKLLQYTCVCTDRPWVPPSLLQKGYRVSFPEVNQPGSWRCHPPPSNAEVKERVEPYLNSLSGSIWPVPGRILPFTLYTCKHWQQVLEVSVVLIMRCSPSHQRISSAKTMSPGVQVWLFLFGLMYNKICPPLSEIPCMDSILVAHYIKWHQLRNAVSYESTFLLFFFSYSLQRGFNIMSLMNWKAYEWKLIMST